MLRQAFSFIFIALSICCSAYGYNNKPDLERQALWDGRSSIVDLSIGWPAGCENYPDRNEVVGSDLQLVGVNLFRWMRASCVTVSSCQKMTAEQTGACHDGSIAGSTSGRYFCPGVKRIQCTVGPGCPCGGGASSTVNFSFGVDKNCSALGRGLVYDPKSQDCKCSRDTVWVPERNACVNMRLRDDSKKPLSCTVSPSFGNPLYPLRGEKRERIDIGSDIGWSDLRLTYSSAGKVPLIGASSDYFEDSHPPGFGTLWSGNLHKRILVDAHGRSARAARGDSHVISFLVPGGGIFTADASVIDKILKLSSSSYRYTDSRQQAIELYDAQGKLDGLHYSVGPAISLQPA